MINERKILEYVCDRCRHRWQSRSFNADIPRICAKCKSVKWNSGIVITNNEPKTIDIKAIAEPKTQYKPTIKAETTTKTVIESNQDELSVDYDFDAGS
jgi:hypothetical protein